VIGVLAALGLSYYGCTLRCCQPEKQKQKAPAAREGSTVEHALLAGYAQPPGQDQPPQPRHQGPPPQGPPPGAPPPGLPPPDLWRKASDGAQAWYVSAATGASAWVPPPGAVVAP
jgi:hypothetical protein